MKYNPWPRQAGKIEVNLTDRNGEREGEGARISPSYSICDLVVLTLLEIVMEVLYKHGVPSTSMMYLSDGIYVFVCVAYVCRSLWAFGMGSL